MRIILILLSFAALALSGWGRDEALFLAAETTPGEALFELRVPGGKPSAWLLLPSPELSEEWRAFEFTFIPEGDGMVRLYIGPRRESEIPYYFTDVKVDGVLLDMAGTCQDDRDTRLSKWLLRQSRSGDSEIVNPGPANSARASLKVHCREGASRCVMAKKGIPIAVSMKGRVGSVFEALACGLKDAVVNLNEAMKAGGALHGRSLKAGESLIRNVNALIGTSRKELGVAVPPISESESDISRIRARILELSDAYLRGAADKKTSLFLRDHPAVRGGFLKEVGEVARQANHVRTACLVNFMIEAP